MAGGESRAHLDLKRAALFWAREQGFSLAAMEVRVPRSGFRCDVAAYQSEAEGDTACGISALFECKQSRADFLNHSFPEAQGSNELKALAHRKRTMEAQLAIHHPTLRNGDSLFQELETADLSRLPHAGYQRLRREVARLKRGLHERTKFDRITRYRCANRCYLVAREGILEEHEAPEGWGLLLWDGSLEDTEPSPIPRLRLALTPASLETEPGDRLALLERIAAAATRETVRRFGIPRPDRQG